MKAVLISSFLALLLIIPTVGFLGSSCTRASWNPYSVERVAELQKKKESYFLWFTAKYCSTCQVQAPILGSEKLKEFFEQNKIHPFKVDMSRFSTNNVKLLNSFTATGLPAYVLVTAEKVTVVSWESVTSTQALIDELKGGLQ